MCLKRCLNKFIVSNAARCLQPVRYLVPTPTMWWRRNTHTRINVCATHSHTFEHTHTMTHTHTHTHTQVPHMHTYINTRTYYITCNKSQQSESEDNKEFPVLTNQSYGSPSLWTRGLCTFQTYRKHQEPPAVLPPLPNSHTNTHTNVHTESFTRTKKQIHTQIQINLHTHINMHKHLQSAFTFLLLIGYW